MCPLSSAEPAQSPVPPPESGCAGQLPQTLVEQTLGGGGADSGRECAWTGGRGGDAGAWKTQGQEVIPALAGERGDPRDPTPGPFSAGIRFPS